MTDPRDIALHDAAKSGNLTRVKSAIERGANFNSRDESNKTPILNALSNQGKHRRVVEYLLSLEVEIKVKETDGRLLLFWAAENGYTDIAKTMIFRGADPNGKMRINNMTPLHIAAKNGREEVVRLLIEQGADPKPADLHRKTPLHYAAEEGRIDVVRFLVSRYPEMSGMKDEDEWTPLFYAVERGYFNVVKSLVESGADLNVRDGFGKTALSIALAEKDKNIEKYLRSVGAPA